MDTESMEHDVGKNDDFFDDEHAKQNGDVPMGLLNGDVPPVISDHENKEEKKIVEANDENEDGKREEESSEDKHQNDDVVAAGEHGGDAADDDLVAAGEHGGDAADVGNPEEPADEGFQSTSPLPTTDGVQSTSPLPTTDGVQSTSPLLKTETEHPKPEENHLEAEGNDVEVNDPEQEINDPGPKPHEDNSSEMGDDVIQADNDLQPEDQGQTPVKHMEDGEVKVHAEEEGVQDYDDSFSECSQKSLASIDSTGKNMNTKIDVEKPEADENRVKEEPSQDPQTSLPPSPAPSDFRAEAGTVVPVVEQAGDDHRTDGRSSVEVKENGEYRGEDRTEVSLPEGTEDSRGQGQWQSAEQQYFASAVLVHKSEQDALKEMEDERDQLLEDQKDMKSSLCDLEKEVEKKGDFLLAEKEINASKEKTIKELKEELNTLYSKQGEGSEERIKDLQERLAILARENEEKDERITKLTEELKETSTKLKETERRLVISEETKAATNPEAPKSKTCVVM